MKTFGDHSISSLFYGISKLGLYAALGFLGFFILFFILGLISYWIDWDNPLVAMSFDGNFELYIKPLGTYIKGERGLPYIIPLVIFTVVVFYILVLYYLSKLFLVFKSEQIFKSEVIKNLTGLSYTFLIVAVLSFCMMYFSPHDDSELLAGTLLLIVSPIIFFIREVFKRGVDVQEDHNLTI